MTRTITSSRIAWIGLLVLLFALSFIFCAGETFATGSGYETLRIVHDRNSIPEQGSLYRGTPYIPLNALLRIGKSDAFCVDTAHAGGARITVDLGQLQCFIGDSETTQFIKKYGGTVYIPLRRIDGELHAPLNTVSQIAGLAYTISGKTLYTTPLTRELETGRIRKDGAGGLSPLIGGQGSPLSFSKDELLFILRKTETLYEVETISGRRAYVRQSDVHLESSDESSLHLYYEARKKPDYHQKINVAWHYVGAGTPSAPDANRGIDIVAPTWFHQIVEGGGNITNTADLGYTRTAKSNGFHVWATITNSMSTKGSTNYTTKVLANPDLRNKTIAQYLFYAMLYEVDGINIDYEDVRDADRNALTAFVREMRKYTERLGLTLSIDTLIPKPWTVEYDYAALGKTVDYIAVMTYDQHYSSSPTAGSVASLPWVDTAIRDLLTYVEGDKILMGIPLYARLWTVSANGSVISNPALTMSGARSRIDSWNVTPTWLPDVGQYYAQRRNGNHTDRIWLEDARSLAGRLALVYRHGLAGSACWQYTLGDESAWQVFESVYRHGVSPGSFTAPY